jgi:glycosyltransferase involved in cell wall biosynthesis
VKILYFTRDDSIHDRRFLAAMISAGMEVFLLRLLGKSGGLQDLPHGVREIRWSKELAESNHANIDLAVNFKQIIQQIQPDLIHAGPLTDCALIAAESGFQPLVSMSWGSDILERGNWNFRKKKNLQTVLKNTAILIGDCEAVKSKAISLKYPQERIVIFPWGVDLKSFSPGSGAKLRKKWGYEDKFVILSMRSWEPIYGVDVVIKAFLLAAEKNRDLRLVLCGNGSQREKINRMIDESNLRDRFLSLGQVSQAELPQVYRASDLYLSASHSDGSSVSLMEAMACGIPVLLSDIVGNREWVVDGVNGRLFQDGKVQQLVSLILSLARQKSTLIKMGRNNRILAMKKADWKKNSKGLLDAYAKAMNMRELH